MWVGHWGGDPSKPGVEVGKLTKEKKRKVHEDSLRCRLLPGVIYGDTLPWGTLWGTAMGLGSSGLCLLTLALPRQRAGPSGGKPIFLEPSAKPVPQHWRKAAGRVSETKGHVR